VQRHVLDESDHRDSLPKSINSRQEPPGVMTFGMKRTVCAPSDRRRRAVDPNLNVLLGTNPAARSKHSAGTAEPMSNINDSEREIPAGKCSGRTKTCCVTQRWEIHGQVSTKRGCRSRPGSRSRSPASPHWTGRIPSSWPSLAATGGDISPDGQRLVVSDYFTVRTKRCCPRRAAFDAVWRQEFTAIPLGFGLQVEGVCYRADGRAIIAASEESRARWWRLQGINSAGQGARMVTLRRSGSRGSVGLTRPGCGYARRSPSGSRYRSMGIWKPVVCCG
jgi:hypothetical protein